jgi:hypothetical protein
MTTRDFKAFLEPDLDYGATWWCALRLLVVIRKERRSPKLSLTFVKLSNWFLRTWKLFVRTINSVVQCMTISDGTISWTPARSHRKLPSQCKNSSNLSDGNGRGAAPDRNAHYTS